MREIKQIEQPRFEIFCRPSNDILAEEVKLPEFALNEIVRIDIPNNNLKDRVGLPKCCHVHIKQLKPSGSKAGPRGSFQKQDAALVEKMKELIDREEVINVRQAVLAVFGEAPRRAGGSDESVIRRLQSRFSEIHPDYVNRRGRKSPSAL